MPIAALNLTTTDGVSIEAELSRPPAGAPTRAGMVLCHPHPLQGGTMRSIVISALFDALPDLGVATLRFNFRGVEASGGEHDYGDGERHDARAAIEALLPQIPAGAPLILAGWSFGADVTLSVHDDRIGAWLAIAAPLRFVHDVDVVALDPRPKVLVLAERDEIRTPQEIATEVQEWVNTSIVVVPGASHFFIGRTDALVVHARELVDRLTGAGGADAR